jgi:hypothetical protein
MTAIPRVLLSEERCKGCGCIFARVPRKDLDPKRCGFCIAQLGEPETVKAA